jgi:hypothetical protein
MPFVPPSSDWTCPSCDFNRSLSPVDVSQASGILTVPNNAYKVLAVIAQSVTCPRCRKTIVNVMLGRALQNGPGATPYRNGEHYQIDHVLVDRQLYPNSGRARRYDEMGVPPEILRDYVEAWRIVDDSPRAAAVLARRCLQQILIAQYEAPKKTTLAKQLMAAKPRVAPKLFEALMTVKLIGNEAAHDPADVADVSADEVAIMMRAIEYFIDDTYVAATRRAAELARVVALRAPASSSDG